MGFHSDRLTFQTDEITNEIRQPQIFLCDRQLNNLGEISPVNDLRIKCSLNGADEISFQTPKDVRNYNDSDLKELNKTSTNPVSRGGNRLYGQLTDYSVILAPGFGYFEVSPSVNDTATEIKNISGSSLGESELSQLLCTLECNTEIDIAREDYVPTILYNANNPDASLIDRILSYAPSYTVGTVDDTIKNIQRTFTFSKTDILSCFSQIAEEINCLFDVVVKKEEDGNVIRQVNIYDACYCGNCNGRNILNGICQDCGSEHIRGIGEDTTIQIGTDNLSDEITISSDGKMKNCFIVEGGDELMTNFVNGISPSGTNKIYQFSEETKNAFSPALRHKYKEYTKKYDSLRTDYEKIFETECKIGDLILYLQSGRMPSAETAKRNLHEETAHILAAYKKNFPSGLGLSSSKDIGSKNNIIRQIFSIFLDDGYAIRQENGEYHPDGKYWTGNLILYEIQNNDSNATICVGKDTSTVTFSDSGTAPTVETFSIIFSEENYKSYVKQKVALHIKNYKYIKDQNKNNPKDWQKYSLNRLYSYQDGYESCRQTLNELRDTADTSNIHPAIDEMLDGYDAQINMISDYVTRLEDMIHFLYFYCGDPDHSSAPKIFKTCEEAFLNMIHYIRYGTWTGGSESENTDTPLYCSDCGSTNVTVNGCNSCHGNVVTYSDLATAIYGYYNEHPDHNLKTQKKTIHDSLNLQTCLGDTLYKELSSHIREDVYTNNNFISNGLENNNTKLINMAKELLQKAGQELEKACVPQHTLSGNIHAFVAFRTLDKKDFPIQNAYDKFKLGNLMKYLSDDGTIYKLRLSSEEFSWEGSEVRLNVEFTDMVHSAGGGISDIDTLVQQIGNLSTSFDSVKKQAEQGSEVKKDFTDIKNEGLFHSLKNALNARNQDVRITDEGITLRRYDHETDGYYDTQMKLVNRNIVLTDDNWKTAKMAVGLGQYSGKPQYGVWADVLVGNLIAGEKLVISNNEDASKATVTIDKNGIDMTNGSICMKNDESSVSVEINPEKKSVFEISKNNEQILGFDENGNAFFKGKVNATGLFSGEVNADRGKIGEWKINGASLIYKSPDDYEQKQYMEFSCDGIWAYKNHLVSIEYNNKKRMVQLKADMNEISFTKYVNTKNDGEIDFTKFSQFYVGNGSSYAAEPVYMELSYPNGNGFIVDENKVELNGLKLDCRSNCYLGGNDYDYSQIQEYIEPDTDLKSDKILNGDMAFITKSISLQKLGRIVIFNAVVLFAGPNTNSIIGQIPIGYRPFVYSSVSADNYANTAECGINDKGQIIFSCSGSGDYRIHGVWFWDAAKEYKDEQYLM